MTFPSPDRRTPLGADGVVEVLRDMSERLRRVERGIPRGITFSADGSLVVPKITLPGAGNGRGTPSIVTGDFPGRPVAVSVTTGSDENRSWIDVSWDWPAATVEQLQIGTFEIRWSRDNQVDWQYGQSLDSPFRIDNLVAGAGYYVQVRSRSTIGNTEGAAGWVNAATYPVAAEADSVAPGQVTGVVLAVANTAIQVSWDERTEADLASYRVQVATSAAFTTTVVDQSITGSILTVEGLDGTAVTYYVRVAAVDVSGNQGAWSATVSDATVLIPSAHIAELTADKIKAGTIGTEVLTLSNSSASRIQSFDGSSMVVRGNGSAQFSNVVITGGSLSIGGQAFIDSLGNADFNTIVCRSATVTGTTRTGDAGDYVELSPSTNDIRLYDGGVLTGVVDFGSFGVQFRGSATGDGLFVDSAGSNVGLTAQGGDLFLGAVTDGSSFPTTNVFVGGEVASTPGNTSVNNSVTINGGHQILNAASGRVGLSANEIMSVGGKTDFRVYIWDGSTWRRSLTVDDGGGGLTNMKFDGAPLPVLTGNTMVYPTSSDQVGYATSSISAKRDVGPIADPVGMLHRLRPCAFRWNADVLERSQRPEDQAAEPGLIAEELAEEFPEWANLDRDGKVTGYREAPLLGLLTAALQTVERRLSALEAA